MAQRKSARVVWRDDLLFTGYSQDGFTIPLDATKAHGGHGAGVSPMELMLMALAGCTGMDVISILQKKQQKVTAFEVQVEGVRAEEHPKVYTEMWVKFVVTGHGVESSAVERAIELSRDKYCGAAATLRPTAVIHYSHDIIEAEPEEH